MHDCRKTKKNLVDLVFGELEAGPQQRALAEVRSCPSCLEEYQSMQATLRIFDQAADATMPEQAYWAGYEARLSAKLAEPVTPNRRELLAPWFASRFAGLLAKPAIPMAVVAGLILFAAISVVWVSRQKTGNPEVLITKTTPTPQPVPTVSTPVQTNVPPTELGTDQASAVAVKSEKSRSHRPMIKPEEKSLPDDVIVKNLPGPELTQTPQTDVSSVADPASHFEKAQLLLRSFRNARPDGKSDTFDLAYEKRQAGKLVNDNILLRREAEARGSLPVEEALISLEPLLLDIANLPNKPSRGEVQVIRERIQRQEMIATLQVVSSGTERFSPPALLNQ